MENLTGFGYLSGFFLGDVRFDMLSDRDARDLGLVPFNGRIAAFGIART